MRAGLVLVVADDFARVVDVARDRARRERVIEQREIAVVVKKSVRPGLPDDLRRIVDAERQRASGADRLRGAVLIDEADVSRWRHPKIRWASVAVTARVVIADDLVAVVDAFEEKLAAGGSGDDG